MNVPTIAMDPEAARAALAEYRGALRRRKATAEDLSLVRGYEALARGQRLLDVEQAIRTAGWDDRQRPRLAIARADRRRVRYDGCWREKTFDSGLADTGPTPKDCRFRFNWPDWPRLEGTITALVPLIPAHLRPRVAHLPQYHVLWEADWQAPPVDPLLLKRLDGHLFLIVAAWNLTELERAILRRRLHPA